MANVAEQISRVMEWLAYVAIPLGLVLIVVTVRADPATYTSTRRFPLSTLDTLKAEDGVPRSARARAAGALLLMLGAVALIVSFAAYAVELALTQ